MVGDYFVIGIYFSLIFVIGIYFARHTDNSSEYLLGGEKMCRFTHWHIMFYDFATFHIHRYGTWRNLQ